MGHLAYGGHIREEDKTARLLGLARDDFRALVQGDLQAILMWLYSSGHTETRTSYSIRGVFDEPAYDEKIPRRLPGTGGKLAVESDQPMAQTARDLGVNANTLPTWMGKYHRVERQEKQVHDEHVYEELKRLRKENARFKEEREILKKAAASFAQQLP
jgi:transposase